MRRAPVVAGQFYHGDAGRLKKQVEGFIMDIPAKERAIGMLAPHAGLMYSGAVAGAVYSSIEFPHTFVLIGPNHTGLGRRASVLSEGQWEIPTGEVSIDGPLARAIKGHALLIEEDPQAHAFEHSLEVQLPFIRYFSEKARIVPITVMGLTPGEAKETGLGIAAAVKETDYSVVIAASSDMSHYVPDALARRKDNLAIERLLALDPEGLLKIVVKEKISMCGYIPAAIMLYASLALGAKKATLIRYATSAEASGDYDHVVGYAGVVVK